MIDNLISDKVVDVKVTIERAGSQVVYLPPYSPDLNPIEMVFSKLKSLVRKLKTRTMEALWQRLGELCDVFLPEECKNYFKHAGYKTRKKLHIKIQYALAGLMCRWERLLKQHQATKIRRV